MFSCYNQIKVFNFLMTKTFNSLILPLLSLDYNCKDLNILFYINGNEIFSNNLYKISNYFKKCYYPLILLTN